MTNAANSRNSETVLMDSVHRMSNAGGSVIHVRTREPLRAALVLRKHFTAASTPYTEWDVVNGFRLFTVENYANHQLAGDTKDFNEALAYPLNQLRIPTSEINTSSEKIHYFVFVNPHPYLLSNPLAAELIQQYAAILPSTNVCTLLISPELSFPDIPAGTVLVAEMPTPSIPELVEVLTRITSEAAQDEIVFPDGSELTADSIQRVASMGLGLSLSEVETYAAISIIEACAARDPALTLDRLMDGIARGKTSVVQQSEILELTHPETIENVGGMGKLKDWIAARAGCYSDDAVGFGIDPPKGVVLVGIPGVGKSLVARVTASVFGVPLVRLDFGRVFSKYVGDSESRVRSALKMVESMAPVVLFVDEIDKALGGAGGGGDSGTSSRVLGSFLTWLQDCKAPVFTVVTANRVEGLPPELLRRGRFDQIFSVGMPNADERLDVLKIHLRKRGRNIDIFHADDVREFLTASDRYVPAEIESAVKDALIYAFSDTTCKDVEMRHIIEALRNMIPMSKSNAAAIEGILQWADNNAVSVSYPAKPPSLNSIAGARIIRARKG